MDVAAGQGREGGDAVHVDSTEREKRTKDEKGALVEHSSPHSASGCGLTGPGKNQQQR